MAVARAGAARCTRYDEIRAVLVGRAVRRMGHDPTVIGRMTALLLTLSGPYDQAARAVAAL